MHDLIDIQKDLANAYFVLPVLYRLAVFDICIALRRVIVRILLEEEEFGKRTVSLDGLDPGYESAGLAFESGRSAADLSDWLFYSLFNRLFDSVCLCIL